MEIVKKLGPYVVLEMLLPGGTLFALALYLYRHRKIFSSRMSIGAAADRL